MSIIFLAPFIMVAVVVKAGGRHPAVITLAGGGTFAGLMVVLQPNAFAFILVGVVGLAAFDAMADGEVVELAGVPSERLAG